MDGASGASACGHYLQMLKKLAHIYCQNGLQVTHRTTATEDRNAPGWNTKKSQVPGINLRSASLRSGAAKIKDGSYYSDHTATCVTRVRTDRNWCLDQ